MIFRLNYSDHSLPNQHQLRQWYFRNGLLLSELAGASLVDAAAQTLTVRRRVPVAGEEDADFPEYAVDDNGDPVTVEDVVALTAPPLRWMLTMTGVRAPESTRTADSRTS